MRAFVAVMKRDLRLSVRQGADAATGLMFFIVVVALFPLAIGPDPAILGPISGGVLMVTALLAATLSFDRLFQQDFDEFRSVQKQHGLGYQRSTKAYRQITPIGVVTIYNQDRSITAPCVV